MSDICKFCGTEPNDSCPGICENFNAARHCAWFSTERLKIIEASGAIEAAIAQEREACAGVLDEAAHMNRRFIEALESAPNAHYLDVQSADVERQIAERVEELAAAIRARSASQSEVANG